ncbi:MAG: hypothetical protein MJ117_00380 [Lachnospiraceae bacterium]|nr:hypothetical protein [Lachnospiraceae bacterium]
MKGIGDRIRFEADWIYDAIKEDHGKYLYNIGIMADALRKIANDADKIDEKLNKYRWHDLRKNPQDLPEPETEVDVVCERKLLPRKLYKNSKPIQIRTHAFYEDGTILENDSVWNWEDIDGEYNEEEDCYVVPEGWWEYRHYNPDEVYNNVIDDIIIAWRYIDPFEDD